MGESRKKQGKSRRRDPDQAIRRYLLLLLIPLTAILIIIAVMVSGEIRRRQEQGSSAPHTEATADPEQMPVIEPDTSQYIQDFGGSILEKDADPNIQYLMERYFLAITDCNTAEFMSLFTSQDTSEEELFLREFEQQRQYVDGYQNISCYTTSGLAEHETAAYVYYEVRYRGVETPAPGLIRVYVLQEGDGQYRIYDGETTQELQAFWDQLSANEDVRLLSVQVDRALAAACEADPALAERIAFLKNGPDYMQAESGAAAGEETDETAAAADGEEASGTAAAAE